MTASRELEFVLAELDAIQNEMNSSFDRYQRDLHDTKIVLSTRVHAIEQVLASAIKVAASSSADAPSPKTLPRVAVVQPAVGAAWSATDGPMKTPQRRLDKGLAHETPSGLASPPVNHALNFDSLMDDIEGVRRSIPADGSIASGTGLSSLVGDPRTWLLAGVTAGGPTAASELAQPCQCLVEFKRQRVALFDSPFTVAPGEYVVVGGDRGEDIGQVTLSWPATHAPPAVVAKTAVKAAERVIRLATGTEVAQLQAVLPAVELKAKERAQQMVLEHGLPMTIVDAEYQFDKKKLTLYYQSQQRLDFRNLVKDLYKTFKARIWMEQDL